MSLISYFILGFIFVVFIVLFAMLSTKNAPVTTRNRIILLLVSALQIVHFTMFLSGILSKLSLLNINAAFTLCVTLSFICFVLSFWLILPISGCTTFIKFLSLLVSIIQIIFTIFIFLLPEAGIWASVQLW